MEYQLIQCDRFFLSFKIVKSFFMTANYDLIAEDYKKLRSSPFVQYVEEYTYFEIIGDLSDKSVLDLGCGYGFHTRKFKEKGAKRVVGVDISAKMIQLAKSQEAKKPIGIEYIIADVCSLDTLGSFDIVVASYLLNHAQNREKLLSICRTISVNLKPNGRFISINNNVEQPPSTYSLTSKYGFTKSISQPLEEGTPITVTFNNYDDQPEISVEDYYLSKATYQWAFRTAGLKELRFLPPIILDEGIEKLGREFWQDLLNYPPIIGITCVK